MAKHRHKLSFTNMGLSADLDIETVAEYCERELPQETLDYLLGPFVRTMFLHPPEQASIAELLWSIKNLTGNSFSLRGGMDSLAKKLAEGLDVCLNTPVERVTSTDHYVEVAIADTNGHKRVERADYCVIATDAKALLELFGEGLTERQTQYLEGLLYSIDHVVSFALSRAPAIDATLVQVPAPMDPELAALVIDNKKGSGRVPQGKGMVTCHFIDSWGQRMIGKSDEEIVATARTSVAKIIPEVDECLEFTNIETWHRAATMSEAGTYQQLSNFTEDLDSTSRVQLCGDYMSLSSVNVSVATSKVAVNNILRSL